VLGRAWRELRGTANVQIPLYFHERAAVEVLDLDLKPMRAVRVVPRDTDHDCYSNVANRRLSGRLPWRPVMVGPSSANHVKKPVYRLDVIG